MLAAFVLGLCVAGWVGWRRGADFPGLFGATRHGEAAVREEPATTQTASDLDALAPRVTALENRIAILGSRADAAADEADRAEALLVAATTRRQVERGAPLGALADRLRLRFGQVQPAAVLTIVSGSRDFVPLDQLAARLEALAPQLTDPGRQHVWTRVWNELSAIFVIHRDQPPVPEAMQRLDSARLALGAGRIEEAITALQALPNSPEVSGWIAAARHTGDVERALDALDATALLPPAAAPPEPQSASADAASGQ